MLLLPGDDLAHVTEQAREAYAIGVRRYEAARKRGRKHSQGFNPTAEEGRLTDGMGAVAEWYVAYLTGREWVTKDLLEPDDGIDVAGGLQVRWTALPFGRLLIHTDEKKATTGVLVIGPMWPRVKVIGWKDITAARQPGWWRTDLREPAYLVPQSALNGYGSPHPLATLPPEAADAPLPAQPTVLANRGLPASSAVHVG